MCLSEGTPLKTVQILKRTTKNSAEQTTMRTKWFKALNISRLKLFRSFSYYRGLFRGGGETEGGFFVKRRPKSARQSRDSTVAAHRVQSVTVPSSRVSRECRSPQVKVPPLNMPDIKELNIPSKSLDYIHRKIFPRILICNSRPEIT